MSSSRSSMTTLWVAAAVAALALADPTIPERPCPKGTTCGSRPNILIIVADDTGLADLGAFDPRGGARRGMPTPNLDRLAADGLILSDFYAQPSCTPGRVALQTGRLPIRSGLTQVQTPGNGGGLHPAEWTLASVLKQAGYRTYLSGKWHLGETRWALPIEHGYDEMESVFLHHLNAYTYGFPEIYEQISPAQLERIYNTTVGIVEGAAPPFGDYVHEVLATRDMTYEKAAFFDEYTKNQSVAKLRELAHDARRTPFFMCVNWVASHGPNIPHPDFVGASGVKNVYGDKLVEMDAFTGELLAALDDVGLRDETLVMFTVDNGAWQDVFPDSGFTPLRGSKGTVREGGFRVPAIFRWPGKIAAGGVDGRITSGLDVMATVARLAGLQLPRTDRDGARITFDSHDLAPILFGEGDGPYGRDTLYYFTEEGDAPSAVRMGEWKAVWDLRGDVGGTPGGEYPAPSLGWRGAARDAAFTPALYNLWEDPQERNDQFMTPLRDNVWISNTLQDALTHILGSFLVYPNRNGSGLPCDEPAVPGYQLAAGCGCHCNFSVGAELTTGAMMEAIQDAAAGRRRSAAVVVDPWTGAADAAAAPPVRGAAYHEQHPWRRAQAGIAREQAAERAVRLGAAPGAAAAESPAARALPWGVGLAALLVLAAAVRAGLRPGAKQVGAAAAVDLEATPLLRHVY